LFAGELPKELPVSLEVLILGDYDDNTNEFTGGIPSELGALTNLKELKMVACDLHGEICMSPSYIRTNAYTFRESQELFLSNLGSWSICKRFGSSGTS